MKSVFDLTEKQQKAFHKLKSAFADCKREGIIFVNSHNRMNAFDSKYVKSSTDIPAMGDMPLEMVNLNGFTAPLDQWIDAEVFLQMTDEALKLIGE